MTDTLELVRSLTDAEWNHLAGRLLTGPFPTARPDQRRPDGDWDVWLVLAGRGWGKTRTGSEDLVEHARAGGDWFAAGPTYADARDVMTEGPTGLLGVLRRRCIAHTWNRSLGELVGEGWRIKVGSADEPERWRGWNFRGGWADEPGSWRRLDTWTQIRLATRLGDHPRIVVTGTPRPTALVMDLAQRTDGTVHVTRGRMLDNVANLSPAFVAEMERRYAGTRIGRQELDGELLLDTPGALWNLAQFEAPGFRVGLAEVPDLVRVVTAVDPAVTSGEDSDETGIVTVGIDHGGDLWVLADDSCRLSPEGWASVAVGALDRWQGDRVVAEVNNGGDLVESVLRAVDRSVPYRKVTASRGKRVRAEPVAALYEQGRVHHVGDLADLEAQMCGWAPDVAQGSPDRVDALVWACTDLELSAARRGGLRTRRAA